MNDGRRYEEVESSSVKLYSLIDNVDKFGSSVAITGGTSAGATLASVTVVVGAPGGTTGAAFVYKLDASGTVIKTFRLVANDATSSSGFGTSVAADGDWVVVGGDGGAEPCLLYTSPSPRDLSTSRMPSSA